MAQTLDQLIAKWTPARNGAYDGGNFGDTAPNLGITGAKPVPGYAAPDGTPLLYEVTYANGTKGYRSDSTVINGKGYTAGHDQPTDMGNGYFDNHRVNSPLDQVTVRTFKDSGGNSMFDDVAGLGKFIAKDIVLPSVGAYYGAQGLGNAFGPGAASAAPGVSSAVPTATTAATPGLADAAVTTAAGAAPATAAGVGATEAGMTLTAEQLGLSTLPEITASSVAAGAPAANAAITSSLGLEALPGVTGATLASVGAQPTTSLAEALAPAAKAGTLTPAQLAQLAKAGISVASLIAGGSAIANSGSSTTGTGTSSSGLESITAPLTNYGSKLTTAGGDGFMSALDKINAPGYEASRRNQGMTDATIGFNTGMNDVMRAATARGTGAGLERFAGQNALLKSKATVAGANLGTADALKTQLGANEAGVRTGANMLGTAGNVKASADQLALSSLNSQRNYDIANAQAKGNTIAGVVGTGLDIIKNAKDYKDGITTIFGAAGASNIDGPGTETSDSISARLSKGESVLNAGATKILGLERIDSLNKAGVQMLRAEGHDPKTTEVKAGAGWFAGSSFFNTMNQQQAVDENQRRYDKQQERQSKLDEINARESEQRLGMGKIQLDAAQRAAKVEEEVRAAGERFGTNFDAQQAATPGLEKSRFLPHRRNFGVLMAQADEALKRGDIKRWEALQEAGHKLRSVAINEALPRALARMEASNGADIGGLLDIHSNFVFDGVKPASYKYDPATDSHEVDYGNGSVRKYSKAERPRLVDFYKDPMALYNAERAYAVEQQKRAAKVADEIAIAQGKPHVLKDENGNERIATMSGGGTAQGAQSFPKSLQPRMSDINKAIIAQKGTVTDMGIAGKQPIANKDTMELANKASALLEANPHLSDENVIEIITNGKPSATPVQVRHPTNGTTLTVPAYVYLGKIYPMTDRAGITPDNPVPAAVTNRFDALQSRDPTTFRRAAQAKVIVQPGLERAPAASPAGFPKGTSPAIEAQRRQIIADELLANPNDPALRSEARRLGIPVPA